MPNDQNSKREVTRPDINLCIESNMQWLDAIIKSELSVINMTTDSVANASRVAEIITVYVHMIEAEARRRYDV